MRTVVCCFAASLAVMLSSVPLASATTFDVRGKWRHCQNTASSLTYRTEFTDPADWYGSGRYLIKSQIRWDLYKSGMWRKQDVSTFQTEWTEITNLDYDFGAPHGDRTVWQNAFDKRWRAHVIVKLIKNRPGPKDKRVETIERFFERPTFREIAPCDGGQLPPPGSQLPSSGGGS